MEVDNIPVLGLNIALSPAEVNIGWLGDGNKQILLAMVSSWTMVRTMTLIVGVLQNTGPPPKGKHSRWYYHHSINQLPLGNWLRVTE